MRPLLKAFSSSMHPESWNLFLVTHSLNPESWIPLPCHPLYRSSDHLTQVSAVASTVLVWQLTRVAGVNMCIGRNSLINWAIGGSPDPLEPLGGREGNPWSGLFFLPILEFQQVYNMHDMLIDTNIIVETTESTYLGKSALMVCIHGCHLLAPPSYSISLLVQKV